MNLRDKRKLRVRKKLKEINSSKYRLSVHKSAKNISAQIIDDKKMKTVISASTLEKEIKSKLSKDNKTSFIAEILAKRAKDKKISEVYFDRGRFKYHGKVKAFADALRKNGMKF